MRVVRDIHALTHNPTHRSLFLLCAETSGSVLCDRDTCHCSELSAAGWKITTYPEVLGLLPEAWSEEGEAWENEQERGAGQLEVWEDEGRVVTLLQHAWRSSGATAASRQAAFSKCNWKDLTPMAHWWLLPTCSCSYTNIPFDPAKVLRAGEEGGGPRGFSSFLRVLGEVSEIPGVPKGAARITEDGPKNLDKVPWVSRCWSVCCWLNLV